MTKTAEVHDLEVPEVPTDQAALVPTLEARAEAIRVISTEAHLVEAREILHLVSDYKSAVKKTFAEPKDMAHKLHKTIVAREKEALEPAEKIEGEVRAALKAHAEKLEEERRAAERAAAEEAAKRVAEQQARLAEAEALRAAGEEEVAEEVIEEASALFTDPMMAAPAPEAPKVSGLSTRKRYVFEVVDAARIPRRFLVVDRAAVQEIVNRSGEAAESIIPGIKVKTEFVPVLR
ncbi:MAG: hypothetical protein KDB94_06105 [Acidobacteria bacterium]|nr:hypothetical protein [Acidobacteriota bacterium]